MTGVVNPVRPSQVVDNTNRWTLITAFDRMTVDVVHPYDNYDNFADYR